MPNRAQTYNKELIQKMKRHVIFCSDGDNMIVNRGKAAELETVDYLVDNLNPGLVGDYRILVNCNMTISGGSSGRTEIDLFVIVRQGVFLLEVKGHYGRIRGYSQHAWRVDRGKMDGNPLSSIEQRAKMIYGKLFNPQFGSLAEYKGQAIGLVVLPNAIDAFEFDDGQSPKPLSIVGLDGDLIQVLSKPTRLLRGGRSRLDDDAIERIKKVLLASPPATAEPEVINRYEILGELDPGVLYEAYEGQHQTVRTHRVRIKVYTLPKLVGEQADYNRRLFEQSARASFKLGGHRNLVRTLEFFPDIENPARYYEITELPPGKRLDTQLKARRRPYSAKLQLRYMQDLCRAVQHAHRNNVLHRNISLETVFITRDNMLKLADFDFARLGDGDYTISRPEESLVENPCVAPELVGDARKATPASDVYSVGAIWYYLAHSLPFSRIESPRADRVDQLTTLPAASQALIARMLDQDGAQRPSLNEVIAALRQLSRSLSEAEAENVQPAARGSAQDAAAEVHPADSGAKSAAPDTPTKPAADVLVISVAAQNNAEVADDSAGEQIDSQEIDDQNVAARAEDARAENASAAVDRHDPDDQQVVDRYRIIRALPSDELFQSFHARHTVLEYDVRLKRYQIKPGQSAGVDALNVFKRNAETVLSLNSPHIVRTIDFFASPQDDTVYYEATELFGTARLLEWLDAQSERVSLEQQITMMRTLSEALAYAHELGILHRNISPRTIRIDALGKVKLSDFHFAHVSGQATVWRPDLSKTLVENECAAPEMYEDPSMATTASDVYSVGAVWFLVARVPGDSTALADIPDATSVDAQLAYLDAPVRELIKRMLSVESANRPQNGTDLLIELDKLGNKK